MNDLEKVDMLFFYWERKQNSHHVAHLYTKGYPGILINYYSLYDF